MPYCSSEAKIQGYEDEPEMTVSDETVDEPDNENSQTTVTVSAEVRLAWACAGCSQESKSGDFSVSTDVEHLCAQEIWDAAEEDERLSRSFTLDLDDPSYTESGGGRYAKKKQGFTLTGRITCDLCGAENDVTFEEEQAASYFETEAH